MQVNHLQYFFEVAKAGSFSKAAANLRISQSALSKAVALLEDSEGVKLFDRSKKGVSLTLIGAEVYRMSAGVFQTITEIQNTCRDTKEVCEGPLRFGASDHVANYILSKQLQEMRRDHPKVVPSVFSGSPNEIVALIANNQLEFGLFFTKVNVPGIIYEPVSTLSMAVVCHPKMVDGISKSPLKISSAKLRSIVQEHGFIGSVTSQYQKHPSQNFMKLTGRETPIVFESNSQETQKRFCLEGGGVAFLARFMVEEELRTGKLSELITSKPLDLELLVAKRKGLPLSLVSRTFLEMLEVHLKGRKN